jgi:CubicO group peptidase (beta-lactamase class C family)
MSSRRSFIKAGSAAAIDLCLPHGSADLKAATSEERRLPSASLRRRERDLIVRTMTAENIPGVSVCLIHDGRPVWVEGIGVTDQVSGRPIRADTIFSIQSSSKNMTAVATLLAVQHGFVDLDAPISEYLPAFTVRSRFESAPEKKITLRLLLSHRAGFTHEAPVGNNYAPEAPDFATHVRSIAATWLRYPVGERYRYSNLGFDLAGYIVELRTRMAFAQWLQTMLFEPLGMLDSTLAAAAYTQRANRAVGHERGYASVPLRTPLVASGGVYTSARDLAAYSLFHLRRGRSGARVILQQKLWDEMHGFALGGDYGFGVIRRELQFGATPVRLLSHQGGGFGFGCVFEYCPEAELAWAALFNSAADGAYRFGRELVDGLLAERFGPAKPRLPARDLARIELPARQLRGLVGHWVGRSFMREMKLEEGVLGLQLGATFAPMHFLSPTRLYRSDEGGESVMYEYSAARGQEPAHLECFVGELSLDYNDGPQDATGPDRESWARFEGNYHLVQWGKPADPVLIHRNKGWLYLNEIRLVVELEPGLFFTSDGEAVDFRSTVPTWRNLQLQRSS